MTTEDPQARLKRMQMRSMRRGIKEMDLVLSAYAADNLAKMDPDELDLYDALLSENDQDIHAWVIGQDTCPDRYSAMISKIAAHASARHA